MRAPASPPMRGLRRRRHRESTRRGEASGWSSPPPHREYPSGVPRCLPLSRCLWTLGCAGLASASVVLGQRRCAAREITLRNRGAPAEAHDPCCLQCHPHYHSLRGHVEDSGSCVVPTRTLDRRNDLRSHDYDYGFQPMGNSWISTWASLASHFTPTGSVSGCSTISCTTSSHATLGVCAQYDSYTQHYNDYIPQATCDDDLYECLPTQHGSRPCSLSASWTSGGTCGPPQGCAEMFLRLVRLRPLGESAWKTAVSLLVCLVKSTTTSSSSMAPPLGMGPLPLPMDVDSVGVAFAQDGSGHGLRIGQNFCALRGDLCFDTRGTHARGETQKTPSFTSYAPAARCLRDMSRV